MQVPLTLQQNNGTPWIFQDFSDAELLHGLWARCSRVVGRVVTSFVYVHHLAARLLTTASMPGMKGSRFTPGWVTY